METPLSHVIPQTSELVSLCHEALNHLQLKFPVVATYPTIPAALDNFSVQLGLVERKIALGETVNEEMTMIVLTRTANYLQEILKHMQQKVDKQKLSDRALAEVVFRSAKVQTLSEVLPYAVVVAPDDLICLPKSHPRWVKLMEAVTIVPAADAAKLAQRINELEQKVMVASAFVSNGLCYRAKYAPELMVGLGTVFYGLNAKKAETQAKMNYAGPTIEGAVVIWNMVDSRLVAPLYEMVVQGVEVNRVVSVPRTVPPIVSTPEYMSRSQ